MPTTVSQPVMSHIDAYPRRNLRAARKQVLGGCSVVSWRDRQGKTIGVCGRGCSMAKSWRWTISFA